MGTFDVEILYHALYVSMVYAGIAFGGVYYRQLVDDLQMKKMPFGELLFEVVDPWYVSATVGWCIVTLATIPIALFASEARIILYVVPLSFVINAIQFWYRSMRQRNRFYTNIVVARQFFSPRMAVVRVDQILSMELIKEFAWYECRCTFEGNGPHGVRTETIRFSKKEKDRVLNYLRNRTQVKIFEDELSLPE